MSEIPLRMVSLNIQLGQNTQTGQPNTFAESGISQLNITGLRVAARIRNAGSILAEASVRVWGLTPSIMNQLATLGLTWNLVPRNVVTIKAGDNKSGMAIVFQGTVWAAYGDYENQPESPFLMEAKFSGANNVTLLAPTSYPKTFAVTDALKTLAGKMGLGFNGYDVNVQLPPMYIAGSPLVQARKLAAAADIDIGSTAAILEATTRAGNNQKSPVVISPATGMISYPSFTGQGIVVKTLFNPQISFKSLIKVQSSILSAISQVQASGNFPSQWTVNKVDLDLDSQLPRGQWMTTCYAYNPGKASTILPPA